MQENEKVGIILYNCSLLMWGKSLESWWKLLYFIDSGLSILFSVFFFFFSPPVESSQSLEVFRQCKDETWQHKNECFRADNHWIRYFKDKQASNVFQLHDVGDIYCQGGMCHLGRRLHKEGHHCALSIQRSARHRGIEKNCNSAQKF